MKKRLFVIYVFLFIFGLFFLTNCSNNSNTETGNLIDSARTIKVVQLEGSANVRDNKETVACFKGMNLYDGDVVDVLANSTLVVKFDEDKYVYLAENTTINIKSDGKDKFKTNIFVEKGKVLAEIQNKLGEDEEFFLSSNNSVMAVRGTTFGVEVIDKGTFFEIAYSVFRGVTELYAFDKKDGNIISGKLTDLSNTKLELTVPKAEILDKDEFNKELSNWLKDIDNKFNDESDANDKLDEVQIKVAELTKNDYQEVIDNTGNKDVTYSSIVYNSNGYFGGYDGEAHKIEINVENEGAKVYYKGENSTEYVETNDFAYTEPGTYRVYYKIVCEGFDDKQDFEVIQISKSNLNVEYTNSFITNTALIAGTPLTQVFNNVNFFDYVNITGAESDNTAILSSTFAYDGVLVEGKRIYKVNVTLPDSIKNKYNSTSIEFEIESFPLIIESTATISTQNNYPELSLDDIASFNKYNGVDEASLFGNPTFKVGTTTLTSNDYNNITYTYNHITEGYYELQTGKNTVDVKIEFDDYEVNTSTYFYFYDTREENSITFNLDEVMIQTIDSNNYWFNAQDMNEEGNNYKISGVYLLSKFGIGSCYINLPTDIIDSNSANYTENNDFLFAKEEVSSVEFTIFPTATVKGAIRKINVYFSIEAPINYPEYTITNLSFMPGEKINFVNSTYPVTYSLDNSSYTANLTISEAGTYRVYYKVGNDTILTSSEVITIVNSTIYSPNLSFISNNMNVLSDDNHSYLTYVSSGELEHVEVNIVTNTGETMSPLNEVYDVYTNIIKNSKYYDSNTMQELDVTITVSDRINGSANFSYKIECDGYDTISGDVVFNYSTNDGLITYGKYATGSTIYNPIDLEISIQDVPVVYASELSISSEDGYINSCMYSKDNGVTWSSDLPSFDEVGEYTVYAIYSYTVNTVDNVLISVQNIKITE